MNKRYVALRDTGASLHEYIRDGVVIRTFYYQVSQKHILLTDIYYGGILKTDGEIFTELTKAPKSWYVYLTDKYYWDVETIIKVSSSLEINKYLMVKELLR